MNIKRNRVLVLNKSFFPLRIEQIQQTFVNMSKGTYLGIDFEYELDDEGIYCFDKISNMITIRSIEEWMNLPIRDFDEVIHTPRFDVRVPPVVVCANFNQIKFPKVMFPTARNIHKRDNYTCAYTGVKLGRSDLSIDHIIPRSRGGRNTWENLVTCDKMLNCEKADRTPKEAGLTLRIKPTKPQNGMVFEVLREEWRVFVDSMK